MKLNEEEKVILDAYDKGKMKTSMPSKKEKEKIKSMAENTFRKDRRVTIRLYDHDLKGIKKKAMEKGMPYQTLISAMIHQYGEGDLVENKKGSHIYGPEVRDSRPSTHSTPRRARGPRLDNAASR